MLDKRIEIIKTNENTCICTNIEKYNKIGGVWLCMELKKHQIIQSGNVYR